MTTPLSFCKRRDRPNVLVMLCLASQHLLELPQLPLTGACCYSVLAGKFKVQMEELKLRSLVQERNTSRVFAGVEKKIDSEIPDCFRKLSSAHIFKRFAFEGS